MSIQSGTYVYTVIYKHNFVDLALIVAFSVSTVIITEY